MKRWDEFARLLTSPEERAAFEMVRTGARRYAAQATFVGSPDLLESILLSVLTDLAVRVRAEPTTPSSRRE
jgi:ribosome-interacting GTPase 1